MLWRDDGAATTVGFQHPKSAKTSRNLSLVFPTQIDLILSKDQSTTQGTSLQPQLITQRFSERAVLWESHLADDRNACFSWER